MLLSDWIVSFESWFMGCRSLMHTRSKPSQEDYFSFVTPLKGFPSVFWSMN